MIRIRFKVAAGVVAGLLMVAGAAYAADEEASLDIDSDWAKKAADAGKKAAEATNAGSGKKLAETKGSEAGTKAATNADNAKKSRAAKAADAKAAAATKTDAAKASASSNADAAKGAASDTVTTVTNADAGKAAPAAKIEPAVPAAKVEPAKPAAAANADAARKPAVGSPDSGAKAATATVGNADAGAMPGADAKKKKAGEKKRKARADRKAAAAKKSAGVQKPAPKPAAPARKPAPSKPVVKAPAPKVAPPGSVQIAKRTTVAANILGKDKILDECQIETSLPVAISERNPNVFLTDKTTASGSVLTLKVVDLRAPGGGILSGPKGLTVDGRLVSGGKLRGTFVAKETSMASVSNCGMLQKVIFEMAGDIAAWIDQPAMNSRLGNSR